jgi:hypothetical protein
MRYELTDYEWSAMGVPELSFKSLHSGRACARPGGEMTQ